jgi:uncharacterized membrane protein
MKNKKFLITFILLLALSMCIFELIQYRDVFVDEAFSLLTVAKPATEFLAQYPFAFLLSPIFFISSAWYLRKKKITTALILGTFATILLIGSQPIAYDVHPPAHYIALQLWTTLFGHTILAARSLSVLFFLLFIGSVFYYVNRWHGTPAAVITGIMLSLSTTMTHYGTEIRQYSMLMFFSVTSFILLRDYLDKPYRDTELFYILNLTLLPFIHYYAVLLLASHALIMWHQTKKLPVKTYIPVFFGIIPALYLFKIQIAHIANMFLAPPTWITYPSSISFALNYTDQLKGVIADQFVLAYCLIIFFLIILATWLDKDDWVLYGLLLVTVPQMFGITLAFFTQTYHPRYYLQFLWLIPVLISITITRMKTYLKSWIPAALILFFVIIGLVIVRAAIPIPKELQTAAPLIPENVTVLHESSFSVDPLMIYQPHSRHIWLTNLTPKQVNSACGAVIPPQNIYYDPHNLPRFDYYLEARHVIPTQNMTLLQDIGGLRVWKNP